MSDFLRKDILNFISGLSLLFILSIFENIKHGFLAAQLSDFISKNDLFRNLLFLILIFFTLEVSGVTISNNKIENKVVLSIILYIFVLLFSKQTIYFSLFQLLIFFTMYGIYYYLTNDDEENVEHVDVKGNDTYYNTLYVLTGLLLFSTLVGFMFYYLKQREDKGENFTILKFLFKARDKTQK